MDLNFCCLVKLIVYSTKMTFVEKCNTIAFFFVFFSLFYILIHVSKEY